LAGWEEIVIFAEKFSVMEINMIVAAGSDGAIGRNGDLIWHISADLKRFKSLTMGHPVIMGRKTWESLPKRPLPGRRNIVVSRNHGLVAPGAEVAHSPEEALRLVEGENPFIMGGAGIYDAFMPKVTRIYLTEIDSVCPEADARLPFPLPESEWALTEAEEPMSTPEGVEYRYATYVRK